MSTSKRRTPAPDMGACILLLFSITLLFAILRTFYVGRDAGQVALHALAYAALLLACAGTAAGLFARRGWARAAGLLLFVLCLLGAIEGFQVPDTARVPAGVLSLFGVLFLLGSGGEFGYNTARLD